jgi:hypothetical protein
MPEVVWRSFTSSPDRGYWHDEIVGWILSYPIPSGIPLWEEGSSAEFDGGVVLVTPGHWRDGEEVNRFLAGYDYALVIVTGDEEGECPFWLISHPRVIVWKQAHRGDPGPQPDRVIPFGWTPGTREANWVRPDKTVRWMFAGQPGPEGNRRRGEAVQAMTLLPDGDLHLSEGFTKGLERGEYFKRMRDAAVVISPPGPNTPDTFRHYEALECGSVPISDLLCDRSIDATYWDRLHVPGLMVSDWTILGDVVEEAIDPRPRMLILASWERAKRRFAWNLHNDLRWLGAEGKAVPEDRITALVTTSPIQSHPDIGIIEETFASIRTRLPGSEIIVVCDGVRSEQADFSSRYVEYLERLIWICRDYRATPLIPGPFGHQANSVRHALHEVRTDLLLFMEHDTPLVGEIPFRRIAEVVNEGHYRTIRFHFEEKIPNEHYYLMKGKVTGEHGLRIQKTVQWSQRPHVTRTDDYRDILQDHFPITSRTMIEDHFYGIVANASWETWRVGIYHPSGGIRRSGHLDGRGSDPKYPMSVS